MLEPWLTASPTEASQKVPSAATFLSAVVVPFFAAAVLSFAVFAPSVAAVPSAVASLMVAQQNVAFQRGVYTLEPSLMASPKSVYKIAPSQIAACMIEASVVVSPMAVCILVAFLM